MIALRNETALVLGLLFLSFWLLALWRVRTGGRPDLRPIAGYDFLRRMVEESAESARPLHVSVGGGGVGDDRSMQTLAGLSLVTELAQPAATSSARLLVSTASPALLPMIQSELRGSFQAAGYPDEFDEAQACFLSDNRNAYAIGAAGLVRDTAPTVSALVGDFGDEYLLLAEPGALYGVPQVAGTGQVRTLPFVWATAEHALLGEEIFAAGAYLGKRATHIASLMAQDQMRLLLVLLVSAGVFLESMAV